jgi:hypothetical protein
MEKGRTSVLQKLTVSFLVMKFPAFYRNRRFVTAFSISRSRLSLSYSIPLRSILILTFQDLRLQSSLFNLVSLTKVFIYFSCLSCVLRTLTYLHAAVTKRFIIKQQELETWRMREWVQYIAADVHNSWLEGTQRAYCRQERFSWRESLLKFTISLSLRYRLNL